MSNKTAIVAGGSAGIGLEVVKQLLAQGYNVGFFGSTQSHVQAVLDNFNNRKALFGRSVNVQNITEINSFYADFKQKMGRRFRTDLQCGSLTKKRRSSHSAT